MAWWLWLLVGLALLGIEMITPGGFFTIFFGVAALIVGVLTRFGLAGPAWTQWIWFSGLSIASLLFLRKPLLAWMQAREVKRPEVDSLIGETAVVLEAGPGRRRREGGAEGDVVDGAERERCGPSGRKALPRAARRRTHPLDRGRLTWRSSTWAPR